ncbi:hypothetical protein IIA16_06485 [bacterium]|nr:hypothetical protein [bacterium]
MNAVETAFLTVGREVDLTGLKTMGLLVRHVGDFLPSVGGMILFGKPAARARHFPQAQVVCARFAGTSKSEFLDSLDIDGTVLDALLGKDVPSFVRRNSRTMSMIPGMMPGIENAQMVMPGFARTDVTEFPAVAIREALVNAIAHADYSQRGMAIRVAIFSDRLEIESPGDLPTGLRLEDLKAGISRIRNPVITRVLKELGLMEQWDSGFKRIREACEEGGYPVPEWEELGTVTRVVFLPHPQVSAAGEAPSRHQVGTKSLTRSLWPRKRVKSSDLLGPVCLSLG